MYRREIGRNRLSLQIYLRNISEDAYSTAGQAGHETVCCDAACVVSPGRTWYVLRFGARGASRSCGGAGSGLGKSGLERDGHRLGEGREGGRFRRGGS